MSRPSQINLYDLNDISKTYSVSNKNNNIEYNSGTLEQTFLCSKFLINDGTTPTDVVKELKDLKTTIATDKTENDSKVVVAKAANDSKVAADKALNDEAVRLAKALNDEAVRLAKEANDLKVIADKALNDEAVRLAKEANDEAVRLAKEANDLNVATAKTVNDSKHNEHKNRLDVLTEGSNLDLNSLKEIVDYYNNLDTNQGNQLSNLINKVNILQNRINYLLDDGSAIVPTPTIPSPPSNVVVDTLNSDNVTLSWNFPSNNGGAPILDYIITSDPQTSEGGVIVNSGTSTYIYSGLMSETTYRFNVQARNSVGVSAIAQSAPVTTPPTPL